MTAAGFATRHTRGDGYSLLKAREFLKHDWRFENASPSIAANYWRSHADEQWTHSNAMRLKQTTPDKADLLKGSPDFLEKQEDELRIFTGGLWGVYVDCSAKLKKKKDWGIMVRVGPSDYITGPRHVYKYITTAYGAKTYDQLKQALTRDEASLRELLNKAVDFLDQKGWDGASFWCSESSKRLLTRLGCRIEKDWVFLFRHYTF